MESKLSYKLQKKGCNDFSYNKSSGPSKGLNKPLWKFNINAMAVAASDSLFKIKSIKSTKTI